MSIAVPTFDEKTNTISIPDVDRVEFTIGNNVVDGDVKIRRNTTVRVRAERGYVLHPNVVREHKFDFVPQTDNAPAEVTPDVPSNVPDETVAEGRTAQPFTGGRSR